ncbi:hypothetical protein MHTCC0001_10860 [Flavobacteriaceae bacterium MHTCC 0001]
MKKIILFAFLISSIFDSFSQTEPFTTYPDGTTSFAGPSSENFQLTGSLSVDSNSGNGSTGDDQWAGTPVNTTIQGSVGTIALCESDKAFRITEIDCWTSENGGSNFAVGDVTFIGYLHGGGSVVYTTTITPTDDTTGYDVINFSGTPLNGIDLVSIEFVLHDDLNYIALDEFDYTITSGLSSYNSVPTASNIAISGSLSTDATLSGTYTFFDCGDGENGTTYKWYTADNLSGTNKTEISGAVSQTYTLTASELNKYILFEVTPSDANGNGVATSSIYYGPVLCGVSIFSKDFEAETVGATSFTSSTQSFSITGSNAEIGTYANGGWNGTIADDQYIDNDADTDANDGGEIKILTGGTGIYVRSFYVWSAEDDLTRSATANLTVTGRRANVDQFTFTKTSGFNISSSESGFTKIDLKIEGSADYSTTLIDELVLSNTGIYEYIAIDAFEWGAVNFNAPTLTTADISVFDHESATLGGEVTDNGCVNVTERGVVYNTTGTPTTSDTKVQIGSGEGMFSQSVSGLNSETLYYVRSYAINSEGTSYGTVKTFTTSSLVAPTITFNDITKTYGDSDFTLNATSNSSGTITYSIIGGANGNSLSGTNNADVAIGNVGDITIRASQAADGSFDSGTKDITLTVDQKAITVTADAISKTYGDSDPTLTYQVTGLVGMDVLSGSLSRATGEAVGTYAIGQGTLDNSNYDITYTSEDLTINQKAATVTADAKSKTYGDSDPTLTYQVTGLVGADVLSGSLSRDTGEAVGTYTINQGTLDNSNYDISYTSDDLTINQKAITVTTDAKSKTYGDSDPTLTYQVTGLVGMDVLSGSLSRATGEAVGTYAIGQGTLDNSNYDITYTSEDLTINQKAATVTADAKSKTYGDSDPTLTYQVTGLVGADVLSGSLSRDTGEAVGTYTINQGTLGNSNYDITYTSEDLTINQKELTVTGLIGNNKVFDGTTAATVSGTESLVGVESGDDVSLDGSPTFTFVSASVGTNITINTTGYTITGSDSGNYTLTQPILSADITEALGLEDTLLKGSITLYPLPVKEELHIKADGAKIDKVALYDITGKLIVKLQFENTSIKTSSISTGVYLLKIETDKGAMVKRIVKQ